MKKVIIIGIVLIVGGFFAFFDVNIEDDNRLKFLEDHKTELGCISYNAEKVLSTNPDKEGIKLTFVGCPIDTTNMDHYRKVSEELAIQIDQTLNVTNEFRNIILIFKPKDQNGIPINEFMSIEELKYSHKSSEL